MNRNLSLFDRIMIAITFAEAGELDWNEELADKGMSNQDRQSWTSRMPDGKLMPTPVAH
jgi:hypothetical protein